MYAFTWTLDLQKPDPSQRKKVLEQVFFPSRSPIRFHCIIIKKRAGLLKWQNLTLNTCRENTFYSKEGSFREKQNGPFSAPMPSSPLEFPTKFVSQFMHVDTNVTHSCATIALVPLFTHFRFSLRNENFWVIFKHCAILGATKWKKIFCTKKKDGICV